MPFVMVEITDIQGPAVKLINPPRGVDVVPAFGCIVLVAANQQKRPWRDQSQQLVLIRGVVHLLNEITEVPIVFIIRKRQADATLVTDDGSNPVIKCRSVKRHFRPERVPDNSDAHAVYFGHCVQMVDQAVRIPDPLSETCTLRMPEFEICHCLAVPLAVALAVPPNCHSDVSLLHRHVRKRIDTNGHKFAP